MAAARIEIPASLRSTATVITYPVIYGLVMVIGHWIIDGFDPGYAILPVIVIVICLGWARYRTRRPAVVIDHQGLRWHQEEVDWSGLALVWVEGRAVWFGRSRRGRTLSVTAWSLAGLEFAQRSGFAPTERVRHIVWSDRDQNEIADLMRSMAPTWVRFRTGPGQQAYLKQLRDGGEIFPSPVDADPVDRAS